jgi:hypothetical protein
LARGVRDRDGRSGARGRDALIRSDGATSTPARSTDGAVSTVEPATRVPGLIKAGLQPRPLSPIPVDETATVEMTPAGSDTMPGGEVRRKFGA